MKENWLEVASELTERGEDFVLVTLIGARGSTPRDSGTKMVVTSDNSHGSIGGGHLEYKVIATAQELLAGEFGETEQHFENYLLGPSLGQCCGGSTTVLFERFIATQVNIMLFGAGHVGQALISIFAGLPCRATWVDSREHQFPEFIPANVRAVTSEEPAYEVDSMPANSYYIIMTHSHQTDFLLCEKILQRRDFRYLGLIGSQTKWRRFEQRLQHKQYPQEMIDRIKCPVGLCEVPGKHPMEVAVSIAGEVISLYHKDQLNYATQQGVHWKEVKALLATEQANLEKFSKTLENSD